MTIRFDEPCPNKPFTLYPVKRRAIRSAAPHCSAKDRFAASIRAAIETECRRRKIGRYYVLAHVVQIVNQASNGTRWQQLQNAGVEGRKPAPERIA